MVDVSAYINQLNSITALGSKQSAFESQAAALRLQKQAAEEAARAEAARALVNRVGIGQITPGTPGTIGSGSTDTFNNFFNAIAGQESGGRYNALGQVNKNGDRAYGKYQIMGANIPQWSKQYLGQSITPQQYLQSKDYQDKIARGKLNDYYSQYGYAGAASAWYSGSAKNVNSTRPQYGGPSVASYVAQIRTRMGLSSGVSTNTGGGSSPPPHRSGIGDAAFSGTYWGTPGTSSFVRNNLTSFKTSSGQTVSINNKAAANFRGFLTALWNQGYHWKSIGSYNYRNKVGGSTQLSQHAYGNAIDIDPNLNPLHGSNFGALPFNIEALARQYGLTWGGNFRSRDLMHFERA